MKTSIVGCGSISATHIGALAEIDDVKIISTADCNLERSRAAAEACGAEPYGSIDELLLGEKPDVVHICTPHYLHVPMALKALAMGINVLCEKPCAINADELKLLRRAARDSGASFGVCFQNRYNHSSLYLKSIVDSGRYGRITGVRAFVTWRRDADYYASGDWRGTASQEGGGVLINQAIHTLDLMQWLCGEVKNLSAHCFNDHLEGIIEVEDTAGVFLEFSGGFRGVFYATNANYTTSPIMLEVSFERKTLRVEGDRVFEADDEIIKTVTDSDCAPLPGKACWGSGHSALIGDFYSCLRENKPFWLDAEEGGKAEELLFRIYQSAAQQR